MMDKDEFVSVVKKAIDLSVKLKGCVDPEIVAGSLRRIMISGKEGHPTPSYLDNALWMIKEAVDGLPEFVNVGLNPFENSELVFKNDVFEVEAFAWDESYDQPYNFKFRDIEVSWYKYLGRGMRVNRDVSALECAEMVAKCIGSLKSDVD